MNHLTRPKGHDPEEPAYFKFRLYVAGRSANSLQAIANLDAICGQYLPERHEIEIVDVFLDSKMALEDGVLLTPMLIKLAPLPVLKIVGSLNEHGIVLQALGLPGVNS